METFRWSNPLEVDMSAPYLYFIRIRSPSNEYRYVGKGSAPSRMDAYWKNVEKVLSGNPKRPAFKRDGSPQSTGNIRFRYVHLILAAAVRRGWQIEHYPLENCAKEQLGTLEAKRISELKCNMNGGQSWHVEEF